MNAVKRIAVVTASTSRLGGGVSESARLLVTAALRKADASIEVLTLQDRHFDDDLPLWKGVKVSAHPIWGPKAYGLSPGLLAALLSGNYDLVHVHGLWMFHCAAAQAWSRITGRPFIVTPHGMLEPWILRRSSIRKGLVSRLYQDGFMRQARLVHVLTEKEREDVRRPFPQARCRVIPNFAIRPESQPPHPSWWRDDFDGKDVYLFLGRIHEKKGCLELLEAWRTHSKKDKAFANRSVLLFCGWLDGLNDFPEAVEAARTTAPNVFFLGPQYGPDKESAIASCDYFVLPSKSEGLPMAVLEAWAYGKPALISEQCNLPLGFSRGAALLTPPNAEGIITVLARASAMPSPQRREMATAALRLVQDAYSIDQVGDLVNDMYNTAMISPDPTSRSAKAGQGD